MDTLKKWFGTQKPEPVDQAALNRKHLDPVIKGMAAVKVNANHLNDPNGPNAVLWATAAAAQLDNAPTVSNYDTAVFDAEFLKIVQDIASSLEQKNLLAFQGGTQTFRKALALRKDLTRQELEKPEESLQRKNEEIRSLSVCLETLLGVEQEKKNVEAQKADLEAAKAESDRLFEEVKELCEQRPDLVSKIKTFRVGLDSPDSDVAELSEKMKRATLAANNVENLRYSIVQGEYRIFSAESLMDNLRHINKGTSLSLDHITAQMQEAMAAYSRTILETEKEIEQCNELAEEYNSMLKSAFTSPEMGQRILEANEAFERLQHHREQQKQAIEAARRKKQENESVQNENAAPVLLVN